MMSFPGWEHFAQAVAAFLIETHVDMASVTPLGEEAVPGLP